MPNKKSAEKMVRRNEMARIRNKSQMSTLKTYRKKFEQSLNVLDTDVEISFKKVQSLLAKAGRKGLIPKGRASRIIGKLMKKKIAYQSNAQA